MRTIHKLLIGGLGTALLAGAAFAASHEHVMTVKMADGELAHITYFGDTAPKVEVVPGQPQRIAFADEGLSPFAEMDRVSAMMDAQMNGMMRQVAAMQSQAPAMTADGTPHMAAFSNLPKGAHVHYSYSSTTVGSDGCAQTVSWSSNGAANTQPKMVRTSSGSCGGGSYGGGAKPLMTSASKPAEGAPSHKI